MNHLSSFETRLSNVALSKFLCATFLVFLICPAFAAQQRHGTSTVEIANTLPARLQSYISQPNFSAASWGVKVVSLKTGRTLFEHNGNKLMIPASNAKLYTAALALDRLGPDYRIKTSLYAAARPDASGILKGDLIVYGRGDPTFAARFNDGDYQKSLGPIVEATAAAGVKRIEGDLIGDESFFRGPPFGANWNWDDLQFYYGAEVSALTVDDNVIDLILKPAQDIGVPCVIAMSPTTTFLNLINRTTTAAQNVQRRINIYRPIGENVAYVSGSLPRGSSNHTDAVTVHNPAAWFVAAFKEALAQRGITVSGKLRTVNWLERETNRLDLSNLVEIGTVESRPLVEILNKMMKPSQNLYAQLLLLQVGAWSESVASSQRKAEEQKSLTDSPVRRFPGSPLQYPTMARSTEELGLAELEKFLKEAGIKKGDVLLEEGSGLSRGCLLTPNATVQLLRFMSRHPYADVYRESLPIAGVDGTLRNRMKGTKAANNVRAKTGSLRYVDTLSGYLTTAGGEPLAFSVMLNNYNAASKSGRAAIDDLIVMLASSRGRSSKRSE